MNERSRFIKISENGKRKKSDSDNDGGRTNWISLKHY